MPALRTRRTRRSPRFRAALAFAALAGVLSAGVASGGTAAAKESAASPTDGWTRTSFTYSMHKPWNLDLSERYGYNSGTKTHTMWVNSTDEPLEEGSDTDPRTEMRWKQEYSSGKHMWDADVYVPSGTNGADIMQILRGKHPSGTPATDIMLRASSANGGTLRRYTDAVIKTGIYNTWWNLKVAHDADAGKIQVYADDKLVLTVDDRGPATRYFKNGVYHHGSGRAEARFRNIRYWVK
ncbi:polysaccharide lyase family 7 protein [Streptomyces sp. DSM 41524]|uniref:Polysaccharide lyase family 7 protein n=1 Tax=Streptomyces asiaticus subsp. ignotus TaxID=3098222 RepID=A0ABU7PWJ7_9ACTN|nr:polysaccharide lyase family 7 protein [Streptomyces sp. DSM 41524]